MSSVLDVNADTWKQEIEEYDALVVVDFWHEHCVWCKKLDPIYSEVSEDYKNKVKFAKLNILENQENQQIAAKYGVMGTPTLVFFCKGRQIESIVGFQPKEQLSKLVDDVVSKHQECLEKSTLLKTS